MAIFIQARDGTKYYMDSVFDVSYSQSGSPTEYAVESGVSSSDHYNQQQDVISMSGAISQVKFISPKGEQTDLDVFVKGLTNLKKSGQFFSVSFSDNLEVMRNCLFTSLNLSQNVGTGKYAYDVSMTITKVIVAKQAGTVATPEALQQYKDIVNPSSDVGAGSTLTPSQARQKEVERLRDAAGSEFITGERGG